MTKYNFVIMTKKSTRKKKLDQKTLFRFFYLLEQNDMNLRKTAREVGIDPGGFSRHKKKYWQAYLNHKSKVMDEVHDIQAVKLKNVQEFAEIKDLFTDTLKLAIHRAREILNDPEKLETMAHSNLIQFINVISPYAAEKLGVTATNSNPGNMKSSHTTFVQNIIEQMNIEGYNKLKDNEVKQD
jgi:hypothetical protein